MAATIFIPGVHSNLLDKMFEDEESADVFFQIGNDGREIPAHRAVLSRASEGFKVRLEGNWAGTTKIAHMTRVEERVFRSLLIFIYRGGEIDFETRHLLDVLKLARSFLMQDMVDKITSQEVFDAHAPFHVWSFLSFAVIAPDEELQNRCLTLIDSDAKRFLSLPGFHFVESSVLKLLIGRDTLGIREVDLFNFLVSWSASSCQRQGLEDSAERQRGLMQDFLFDIRYSLMSLEDLFQVEATNILTPDEIKIIRTTITMDPTSIPVQPPAQSSPVQSPAQSPPVQSPAQSSVFLSLLPIKYGVTLNWLLLLLVILLSIMLSTRISSGSSGNKTTTPSALGQIQKELEEAIEIIKQQKELISSLELARLKAERDRDEVTQKINDLAVENQAVKTSVMKAQDQKNYVQPRVQRQPSDSWYMMPKLRLKF